MKINNFSKNKYAKIILSLTAAVLLSGASQSVFAAEETPQSPSTPLENISSENTSIEDLPIESASSETSETEGSQNSAVSENAPIESAEESTTESSSAALPQTPESDSNVGKPQPDSPNNAAQDNSTENDIKITPLQGTFYAAAETLNVRSGPSTKHHKIGHLEYGQAFTVTGKTADNWYQIQYSGSHGYVSMQYVSDTPPVSVGVSDTQAPVETTPIVESQTAPVSELESDEEVSTDETYTETVSNFFGTPVIIALALAILVVLSLITYSVIGLFKKESTNEDYDEYDDDTYDDSIYHENNYDEAIYDDESYDNPAYYEEDSYENDSYENDSYYEDESYYQEDQNQDHHKKRPRRR